MGRWPASRAAWTPVQEYPVRGWSWRHPGLASSPRPPMAPVAWEAPERRGGQDRTWRWVVHALSGQPRLASGAIREDGEYRPAGHTIHPFDQSPAEFLGRRHRSPSCPPRPSVSGPSATQLAGRCQHPGPGELRTMASDGATATSGGPIADTDPQGPQGVPAARQLLHYLGARMKPSARQAGAAERWVKPWALSSRTRDDRIARESPQQLPLTVTRWRAVTAPWSQVMACARVSVTGGRPRSTWYACGGRRWTVTSEVGAQPKGGRAYAQLHGSQPLCRPGQTRPPTQ